MSRQMKMILGIIVAILVIGGSAFAIMQNTSDNDSVNKSEAQADQPDAMEKASDDSMSKDSESMTKQDESMQKDETASMSDEDHMSASGNYVTLADYNSNQAKYSDTKKVYFFHASWCPVCQGIDNEINADPSKIPAGYTLIKTDYDQNTDLRQKYGVTYQYTFVEVDDSGNEVNQFSASSLDKVISGLKG